MLYLLAFQYPNRKIGSVHILHWRKVLVGNGVSLRTALCYPKTKSGGTKCASPTSLLYLATNLRANQLEAAVFDPDGYERGLAEMVDRVVDYSPQVVGVPIFTTGYFFKAVKEFCRIIREKLPNAFIVMGAAHASAWPEKTLEWLPEVDFVLTGEADYTLCDLVRQLQTNSAKPEVPGLYQRENGAVISTPQTDPPKDLDAIPIPDRRLVWDNYRRGIYWRLDRKGPVDTVMTSRGCPFSCKFCFKVAPGVRMRSPENVVQELEYLAELGIRNVDILDDLFTTNKRRCAAICQMIMDAGLKLNLKVRSRVDCIDADMLALLRKAGTKAIVYGFESGSQLVLDSMNKRTTVQANYEAVRMTKKAGLACYADLFIGFPGETPETIEETRQFLLRAKPTIINGGVLSPLPCTEVYNEAKANGTLVGDWTLDGPEPYVALPWMNDLKLLWAHWDKVRRSFYRDPAILFQLLRGAPNHFSLSHWRKGLRFVRQMTRRW